MKNAQNPSRRQFLQATGTIAAAGALGLTAMGGATPARARSRADQSRGRGHQGRRPNILLLVDEMRYPPIYEAAGAKQFRQQYLMSQGSPPRMKIAPAIFRRVSPDPECTARSRRRVPPSLRCCNGLRSQLCLPVYRPLPIAAWSNQHHGGCQGSE